MRIAYITPYQGPTLLKRRPIVRNRSMSNRIKIELIAQLLRSNGHEIEVFSHGEVIEHGCRFYPGFSEPERFDPCIPVDYISALPIKRLNGVWAGLQMRQLLARRHRAAPFDLIILFNLKAPQLFCARYAIRHDIRFALEYEDDMFRTVVGESSGELLSSIHHRAYRGALRAASGCIAASPHLLSQVPSRVPALLLRGVVGEDVIRGSRDVEVPKKNIVLFSGTHTKSNGVEELIAAWAQLALCDWELHITGSGERSEEVRRMADRTPGVVFHGLVTRKDLVSLMCSAKICVNPHSVSQTPGNVFAFKIIEYLAAGAHVVTTRMGALEPDAEKGVTYMQDNTPEVIASTLAGVIQGRVYEATATAAMHATYGASAVSTALDRFVREVGSAAICRPGGR